MKFLSTILMLKTFIMKDIQSNCNVSRPQLVERVGTDGKYGKLIDGLIKKTKTWKTYRKT